MRWYSCDTETSSSQDGTEAWIWSWGLCPVDAPDEIVYGGDIDSLIDALCDLVSCRVYFHNLKFDGEFIMTRLLQLGWVWQDEDKKQKARTFKTLITDDRSVYKISLSPRGRGYVDLVDSFKVLALPVSKLASAYGLEEGKGELDYGVYRLPNHPMTVEEMDYLRRDVQVVANALSIVRENGDERITAASNALQWYRDSIGGKKAFKHVFPPLEPEQDAFIRKAYRGGFTYADRRFTEKVVGPGLVYDVNSMYPWALRYCKLPILEPRFFTGEPRPDATWELWVALVTFSFDVKVDHIPCIQIKGNLRFGATEYLEHSGAAVTITVSSVDWQLYNEQYDIEVHEWHGGYYFRASDAQFSEYVDYWMGEKVRAAKEGNSGLKSVAKLKLNSLYGKFASRPGGYLRRPELEDGRLRYPLLKDESDQEPIYVPVGVFVTAYARSKIVRTAQSLYPRFAYSDTDSIHIVGLEEPDIDIDQTRLGAWKLEGRFTRAKYLRAKTYIEEMEGDDDITVHVAGMPYGMHDQVDFDNFEFGAVYDGKLYTRHVKNGIILESGPMEIRR